MKKIFIILLCMITLNVNATEMCARDDTVVIPLDATITGDSYSTNPVEWIWWVNFSYGAIYGGAACVSKKEIMMYSDWKGSGNPTSGLFLNTSSDELIGNQGYYMNADINPDIPDSEKSDYERKYCLVRITHPMSTAWMLINSYSTFSACNDANGCLGRVDWISRIVNNKQLLFNSVGTVPPWPMD